eukprot:COSAG01_NODE_346_length_18524_cov_35.929661_3_plen_171_part_00
MPNLTGQRDALKFWNLLISILNPPNGRSTSRIHAGEPLNTYQIGQCGRGTSLCQVGSSLPLTHFAEARCSVLAGTACTLASASHPVGNNKTVTHKCSHANFQWWYLKYLRPQRRCLSLVYAWKREKEVVACPQYRNDNCWRWQITSAGRTRRHGNIYRLKPIVDLQRAAQ